MVYFILGILILLLLPFYDTKKYSWYLKQCHNGGLCHCLPLSLLMLV